MARGQGMGGGLVRLGDGSVGRRAWEDVVVRRCVRMFGGGDVEVDVEGGRTERRLRDLWRFMGTADVVTDTLKIIKILGEEKLRYWGFVSLPLSFSIFQSTPKVMFRRATEASWA